MVVLYRLKASAALQLGLPGGGGDEAGGGVGLAAPDDLFLPSDDAAIAQEVACDDGMAGVGDGGGAGDEAQTKVSVKCQVFRVQFHGRAGC